MLTKGSTIGGTKETFALFTIVALAGWLSLVYKFGTPTYLMHEDRLVISWTTLRAVPLGRFAIKYNSIVSVRPYDPHTDLFSCDYQGDLRSKAAVTIELSHRMLRFCLLKKVFVSPERSQEFIEVLRGQLHREEQTPTPLPVRTAAPPGSKHSHHAA